jgi:polyprenyldihydroxybenzoate methyltransferase/3-demethylubiquinol 3-O-methyltransferase
MPPLPRKLPPPIRRPLLRYSRLTTPIRTYTSPQPPPQPAASSVSPSEISHFNALASTWWDPHGPSRLLHLMNPLRHDFIAGCLAQNAAPAGLQTHQRLRYLDIGCGGGIFAESAARLPATLAVTALDPSPEVYRTAVAHARTDPALATTLTYHNMALEALPAPASPAAQYDVLTLFEVIEHISQPAPFLRACFQHVKPGGWIVLSTIARTWTSWLTTKVVAEDLLGVVPRGTHDWAKYVNVEELEGWFEKEGGWGGARAMGVVYVPGLGWREVTGSERWGNYFFGVRKDGGEAEGR